MMTKRKNLGKKKIRQKPLKLSQSDKHWVRLAERSNRLFYHCNQFMQNLDDTIMEGYRLQEEKKSSPVSQMVHGLTSKEELENTEKIKNLSRRLAKMNKKGEEPTPEDLKDFRDSGKDMHNVFEKQEDKFKEIYRDFLKVDIPNWKLIPESGDDDYFKVMYLRVLLGNMMEDKIDRKDKKQDTFTDDVRRAAQLLQKSLTEMSQSNDSVDEGWKNLLTSFKQLKQTHERLNQQCFDLIRDYEQMTEECAPKHPRNGFKKGDKVRYYISGQKKWVIGTLDEVVDGADKNFEGGETKNVT
eukprot:UN25551